MSEYRLKGGRIEKAAVNAYKKIEKAFVDAFLNEDGTMKTGGLAEKATGTYQKMEDAAVGAYKKVENAFVEAFLEEVRDETDEASADESVENGADDETSDTEKKSEE